MNGSNQINNRKIEENSIVRIKLKRIIKNKAKGLWQ